MNYIERNGVESDRPNIWNLQWECADASGGLFIPSMTRDFNWSGDVPFAPEDCEIIEIGGLLVAVGYTEQESSAIFELANRIQVPPKKMVEISAFTRDGFRKQGHGMQVVKRSILRLDPIKKSHICFATDVRNWSQTIAKNLAAEKVGEPISFVEGSHPRIIWGVETEQALNRILDRV